jgi:hypothetical protein
VNHASLHAVDPPGTENRLWRCKACGLTGLFDAVRAAPCKARKPAVCTADEQLQAWARGESLCPSTSGECCPDFSCCQPKLQWDEAKRQKFMAADPGTREKMLMGALGAAMALAFEKKGEEKRVHITRGDPTDHE